MSTPSATSSFGVPRSRGLIPIIPIFPILNNPRSFAFGQLRCSPVVVPLYSLFPPCMDWIAELARFMHVSCRNNLHVGKKRESTRTHTMVDPDTRRV